MMNRLPVRAGMVRELMANLSGPRWRLIGLLGAVLAIVLLPYFVIRGSSQQALRAATWVTHSADVKATTYRIAYVGRDRELTTYRLLNGEHDPQLQTRIDGEGAEVDELIVQLAALTGDNASQQSLIGSLTSMTHGRALSIDDALQRLRRGDRDGGVKVMNDLSRLFPINEIIAQIVANEDRLLESRRAVAQRQSRNNDWVLLLSALAQLVLLGTIVWVSERQIGRRVLAEASRVLAEARESQAVKRSQMILHAVREPIALLDHELRTLLVNAAFCELYGMTPEERLPLAEVGHGAWSDNALQQRLRDVIARDRELWDFEFAQQTQDGPERRVMMNARRLQQETGEPMLLLTLSDITVRALAEQQVNELNRQLAGKVEQITDVNRELEAFSYSVSHDLRAPLRHIGGFASKLEQHLGEQADEQALHYLNVISSSARRMAQLIDDLLVFSRLGRGAMRMQPVDMQSLVDEARAMADAEATGRRVVWSIEALPVVIGDENMLRTVWQNLLDNAIKYTGQREVARIAVRVQVHRGKRDEYEFTVSDNGAGFDMEYAGKLFGVFQRLHRASDFPGTGIGLANVRRIISRHGGRTWAEAEPDKGATFHFTLPSAEPVSTNEPRYL
jgi:PAS domain S-box-containing protein